MNKLLFLVPLATAILILIGMYFFGSGGLDWLITNSFVIIVATFFASNFINFYQKNHSPFDLTFAILFCIMAGNFILGMILSDAYFWLFVDVYMIIVNILGAARFFAITRNS